MSRARLICAIAAVGLGLSGCVSTVAEDSGASAGEAVATTTAVSNTAAPGAAATVPTAGTEATGAESIVVDLVGGGQLDLAAYMDQPLLLWFWAPF